MRPTQYTPWSGDGSDHNAMNFEIRANHEALSYKERGQFDSSSLAPVQQMRSIDAIKRMIDSFDMTNGTYNLTDVDMILIENFVNGADTDILDPNGRPWADWELYYDVAGNPLQPQTFVEGPYTVKLPPETEEELETAHNWQLWCEEQNRLLGGKRAEIYAQGGYAAVAEAVKYVKLDERQMQYNIDRYNYQQELIERKTKEFEELKGVLKRKFNEFKARQATSDIQQFLQDDFDRYENLADKPYWLRPILDNMSYEEVTHMLLPAESDIAYQLFQYFNAEIPADRMSDYNNRVSDSSSELGSNEWTELEKAIDVSKKILTKTDKELEGLVDDDYEMIQSELWELEDACSSPNLTQVGYVFRMRQWLIAAESVRRILEQKKLISIDYNLVPDEIRYRHQGTQNQEDNMKINQNYKSAGQKDWRQSMGMNNNNNNQQKWGSNTWGNQNSNGWGQNNQNNNNNNGWNSNNSNWGNNNNNSNGWGNNNQNNGWNNNNSNWGNNNNNSNGWNNNNSNGWGQNQNNGWGNNNSNWSNNNQNNGWGNNNNNSNWANSGSNWGNNSNWNNTQSRGWTPNNNNNGWRPGGSTWSPNNGWNNSKVNWDVVEKLIGELRANRAFVSSMHDSTYNTAWKDVAPLLYSKDAKTLSNVIKALRARTFQDGSIRFVNPNVFTQILNEINPQVSQSGFKCSDNYSQYENESNDFQPWNTPNWNQQQNWNQGQGNWGANQGTNWNQNPNTWGQNPNWNQGSWGNNQGSVNWGANQNNGWNQQQNEQQQWARFWASQGLDPNGSPWQQPNQNQGQGNWGNNQSNSATFMKNNTSDTGFPQRTTN